MAPVESVCIVNVPASPAQAKAVCNIFIYAKIKDFLTVFEFGTGHFRVGVK